RFERLRSWVPRTHLPSTGPRSLSPLSATSSRPWRRRRRGCRARWRVRPRRPGTRSAPAARGESSSGATPTPRALPDGSGPCRGWPAPPAARTMYGMRTGVGERVELRVPRARRAKGLRAGGRAGVALSDGARRRLDQHADEELGVEEPPAPSEEDVAAALRV